VPRLPLQAELLRRALIAASVLALAGCGGGKDHAQATPAPAAGSPTLALADCNQWREMRQSTRRGLVTQMNIFFGAKADNGFGKGQTLSDEMAFTVITRGCKPKWAGAVKLYKLYGRAAAFTP
jgi:hypothetical protein